jgi:hypothetical protein
MTLIDPDTHTWTCCGLSVHAPGCTANLGSYRYGSEPTWSAAGLRQVSPCRDCGAHLGHHHHDRCCLAFCRRCNQQQLTCSCDTRLELVR